MKKIITIKKMGINGEGIGYLDKLPVFVDGALPTEKVEVEIGEHNGRYAKGQLTQIINFSNERVKPACPYQDKCGGCALMTLKYDAQLKYKRELLTQALIKYAQIDPKKVSQVVRNDRPLGYRNQCRLACGINEGTFMGAMYSPNSNRPIYITNCAIHEEGLERCRAKVNEVLNKHHCLAYDKNKRMGYRYIVIRAFDNFYQCTLVTGKQTVDKKVVEDLMKIKGLSSLYQNINYTKNSPEIMTQQFKHLAGDKQIKLNVDGLKFNLNPDSFFQLNTNQAIKLYKHAVSLIPPSKHLVEAYCGIGVMSFMAIDKADKITGIEYTSSAIKTAKQTAKRMNLEDKVDFISGDCAKVINEISNFDTLLVDPPRSGMDDDMLKAIHDKQPETIIYVSCNPSTLAKNIKVLSDLYTVDKIIPFDIFSQTVHVESITVMKKKTM